MNAPQIRIGIIQNTQELVFSATGPFTLVADGRKVYVGEQNQRFKVKIASATSGGLVYRVLARKLKEEQQVKELKEKFDSQYPVETRKVGKKIESRDGKL
ncbi:MAG TPA: hypothetical protein EYP60_05285, partial [bacterium (Candidatus Stahlbacteria)]|nr:hypothetical protein [Candidatus Stahlbacteria bacterium]